MAWCTLPGGYPSSRMPFPALRSSRQRARTMWPGGCVVARDTPHPWIGMLQKFEVIAGRCRCRCR